MIPQERISEGKLELLHHYDRYRLNTIKIL